MSNTTTNVVTNSLNVAGRLSGKVKAAILLVSLAPDAAAAVFKQLTEPEVELLTQTISAMPQVNYETKEAVLREFYSLAKGKARFQVAGPLYARSLLEQSLGPDKAENIMSKMRMKNKEKPFSFVGQVDAGRLTEFIRREHPQTIALILAHLNPSQAGAIMANLQPERQVEVTRRLATLDRADPLLIKEIENVLQRQLFLLGTAEAQVIGGVDVAVNILNRVDSTTEKVILEGLAQVDPALAEEIKERMFVFDDIIYLDTHAMQRVIREVEAKEWALAMRTASEEVTSHIFANMSKRLQELVREEAEYLGLVRLREVEEAQQRIVATIRSLEEAGEIVVSRNEDAEVFV